MSAGACRGASRASSNDWKRTPNGKKCTVLESAARLLPQLLRRHEHEVGAAEHRLLRSTVMLRASGELDARSSMQ